MHARLRNAVPSPSSPGAPTLTSITVSPLNQSIPIGGTQQFNATGTYSDGTVQDVTTSVTWSSSDTSVATISNSAGTNGLATGVAKGSTTIQATQGTPFGKTSFNVTEPLSSIAVTPQNATIASGIPQQFTAIGTYADNSTADITASATWSSSNTSVATISNVAAFNGLASTLAAGSTTIQATLYGIPGSTGLTVGSAVQVGVIVSPQNPVIANAGATQQFNAIAQYSDGTTQDVTSSATWTSTNTGVAHRQHARTRHESLASFRSICRIRFHSGCLGYLHGGFHSQRDVSYRQWFRRRLHSAQRHFAHRTERQRNCSHHGRSQQYVHVRKVILQAVDGQLYAQPLYVPNVSISGVVHNVIYVATEGDSVYAFDAGSNTGANANPLWHASLIDTAHGAAAGATTVSSGNGASTDVNCGNIISQIGITATPVIDPSTNTMYVAAESKENGSFFQRLHALDITTGAEKSPGPTVVTGTFPGTADGTTTVTFNPLMHLSRPGLLLLNGTVDIAYASNCDNTPYHGWLFAYDAGTFNQTGVYVTTPNGGLGGFWMSGDGIAADSNGNIYIPSGNGDFDTTDVPAVELGDSILKLNLRGSLLTLVDYFTPYDQDKLDTGDVDVGSGGLVLLPDQPGANTHLLVQAGKEGTVYLIDRDQLTANNEHYCANCTSNPQIVQELTQVIGGGMWSMPAYWNNNLYFWGSGDSLTAFGLSSGLLTTLPTSSSTLSLTYPGSVPSVSADGTTNGIVWAIDATNFSSSQPVTGQAVLHAFDATNLNNELYNSKMAANSRDQAGIGVKFSVPTIANGKVYIGTQTELDVYGPLP